MSKKKKVDLDTRPNLFFKNYDYGGPEDGGESGPGTGLYHGNMSKYKSVRDFLETARKRRSRKRKMAFLALAGDVIDFKKKLQEKKEQEEQQRIKDNFTSIENISPEVPIFDDLEKIRNKYDEKG